MLLTCLAFVALAQGPSEHTALDVINLWEAGASLIDSYEIQQKLESQSYVSLDNDKKLTFRAPGSGGKILSRTARVWKMGQKRRGEFGLDLGTSLPELTIVFDGDRFSLRALRNSSVEIRAGLVSFGAVEYEDYETLYRTISGAVDRIAMTRGRKSVLLPKDGNLLVIESPPSGNSEYNNVGWKVWIDPSRNFLPVRISQWMITGERKILDRDIQIVLAEVAPGVWAPVRGNTTIYFKGSDPKHWGKVGQANMLYLDVDKCKFNNDVDPKLFASIIRDGDTVVDSIRNITYVQGSSDPEKHLKSLADQARTTTSKLRGRQGARPVIIPEEKNIWPWIGVAAIALAGIAIRIARKYFGG